MATLSNAEAANVNVPSTAGRFDMARVHFAARKRNSEFGEAYATAIANVLKDPVYARSYQIASQANWAAYSGGVAADPTTYTGF